MKRKPDETPPLCPCGSGREAADCCARFHAGEAAPDAEALMRSRYTAYVLADEAYLLATWHVSTRPQGLGLAADGNVRWLGLTVKRYETSGADTAVVEFVARNKIGGKAFRIHETSRFVREEGRWYYVDGVFDGAPAKPPD